MRSGTPVGVRGTAGGIVGAQTSASPDAVSMASALANAWGVSAPTGDARPSNTEKLGGTRTDAVAAARPQGDSKRSVAAVPNPRPATTGAVKPVAPAAHASATGARAAATGSVRPSVPAGPARGVLISAGAADAPLHRQWDFGDVPEDREVERNRLRLVVYPAIEDRVTGVALVEARNAQAAEVISRAGIVRLALLALPQQAKFVSKRVTDDRDLVLLSRGLSLRQSLADALTQRAFRECFLPADVALPRSAQDFTRVLDDRRAQLSEVADRLATMITLALKEWRAARAALDGLRAGSFADVVAEVTAQLALLLPPDFIESTPRPWLDYLPRYLKAVTRRIERLPPNVRRDAELAAKIRPFAVALRTFMAEPVISGVRPELEELRWMIEEFRVSLFAQELKTMVRVSEKRLEEQVRLVRESQR